MIVVAGEALIDLLVDATGRVIARPGGGPYNTARTIGRLGVAVTFLGRLSGDRFGREMAARLVEDGVTVAIPEPTTEPTTLALAELDAGQATYHFYLEGTSAPGLGARDLATAGLPDPVAVHVGTLGLAAEPVGSTLERYVGGLPRGVLVMLDPNCRPSAIVDATAYRARIGRMLARADVLKVSREDLAFLRPGTDPGTASRGLLGPDPGRGPSLVLLTAGSAAVRAFTRTDELHVPVPSVDVVDTVGAGDAFGGAFLAWWRRAGLGRAELSDASAVRPAVEAAVEVAASTCTRPGADPPRLAEVRRPGSRWAVTP